MPEAPRRVLGPGGGKRVLGPGGKRTLGPKRGGGGACGGGGSSAADQATRKRGCIVMTKPAEKFGFIQPFSEKDEIQKRLYFSFADCDCDPLRLRPKDAVTFAPPEGKLDRATHVELDLVGCRVDSLWRRVSRRRRGVPCG